MTGGIGKLSSSRSTLERFVHALQFFAPSICSWMSCILQTIRTTCPCAFRWGGGTRTSDRKPSDVPFEAALRFEYLLVFSGPASTCRYKRLDPRGATSQSTAFFQASGPADRRNGPIADSRSPMAPDGWPHPYHCGNADASVRMPPAVPQRICARALSDINMDAYPFG